jgi:CRP-like cAMP-binding protein
VDPSKLTSIPLFAGLDRRERDVVGRWADEVDVREGEQLVDEGDFGHEFFAIEEGTAEVRRGDERLAELGAGEFFGEGALSGDARRNASVVATSPMTVIVMTRSAFHEMRRELPQVCARIEEAVRERGRRVEES